ncbi:hypothetical protein [Nocardiopsis sp. NRRL B-16309]|uniref:hypothetical protein n=1 Tax=Nocardiopsis sp. NRRL B-16309 TaxID=1519494 RepID=UPI0006B0076B|nr:hypothetical protein [Nocardiopsis sp. NRRL B-16309]KOX10126.1 hypothetical protein ADL05_25940 [Nocardiopsis sp. NRRL B-16309]
MAALEGLAQHAAPDTDRSQLDLWLVDRDQVTDADGVPLTGEELVALATRIGEHTHAGPGTLPALPATVEFHRCLVHIGGRALIGGEVAALSVHVASLAQ